jgi:hypothetical protein
MEQFLHTAIRFLERLYASDPLILWIVVAALAVGSVFILTLTFIVCKVKVDQLKLAAWVQEKQAKGRKSFEADVSTFSSVNRSNRQSAHFLDLFSRQWTEEERGAMAIAPQARSRNDANS